MSHTFPSLVLSEGEEEDDTDHNVKDVAAANDYDDNKDNDGTSMPPKVKPLAATKKPAAITEMMTPPTVLPPLNFSIDSTDKFGIAYYCKGTQDFADVVIHVNGCLYESKYHVRIAQDKMSVSWQRSIKSL